MKNSNNPIEYSLDNTVKYFYLIAFLWVNWSIFGDDIYFDNRPFQATIIILLLWGSLLFSIHKIALLNNDKLLFFRVLYKTSLNVKDIKSTVVIDDDIRPSYYTTLTAAIYLDPAQLWLTNAEKNTINRQQDFRADFDNLLNFRTLWRYVIANNYAYSYYSLNGSAERSLSEIILPFSELLFHELAHAKDFIPLDIALTASSTMKPAELASSHRVSRSSVQLQSLSPLNDNVLFDLADVMYRGAAASISLQLLSADEVGDLFEVEGANDHYAYSTAAEDFAMLFEEAMMKYHFNADRDVAFSVAPADETNCLDYLIGWGVRHRLGDVNVKSRAAWAVSELLPSEDFSLFFQNFPLPIAMAQGVNWCENLLLSPLSGRGSVSQAVSSHSATPSTPSAQDRKVLIDPDQWLRPL